MKLLEQLAAKCRTMNFAQSTEECYSAWVNDFLRFHRRLAGKWIHPEQLREPAVETFLTHLTVDRRLAASSQGVAMCSLVFFYRAVLKNNQQVLRLLIPPLRMNKRRPKCCPLMIETRRILRKRLKHRAKPINETAFVPCTFDSLHL